MSHRLAGGVVDPSRAVDETPSPTGGRSARANGQEPPRAIGARRRENSIICYRVWRPRGRPFGRIPRRGGVVRDAASGLGFASPAGMVRHLGTFVDGPACPRRRGPGGSRRRNRSGPALPGSPDRPCRSGMIRRRHARVRVDAERPGLAVRPGDGPARRVEREDLLPGVAVLAYEVALSRDRGCSRIRRGLRPAGPGK
jgi:hypothetical protein